MTSFREYHVPQADGEAVVEPAFSQVGDLLNCNARVVGQAGSFWESLRQQARGQLISDAIRYSSTYRDVGWVGTADCQRIIMAGHQPTLFHPGVWFKNFALSRLAADHQAVAINLVIDNDVASSAAIRVPWVDPASGSVVSETVAYDTGGVGLPHEQTTITDRERFEQFDVAVRRVIRPLVADPCVSELWSYAREAIHRCGIAGCALAQARHRLEQDLHLRTLEVPLGVAVRGPAFARFVLAIMRDPVRFRDSYNESVEQYRSAHGIRSRSHPVPNLARDDDWMETPLWLYGNENPVRRGVWARRRGDRLVISDRAERTLELDMRDEERAADALVAAASPEFKLRPRALMTTMYARFVLSDLFLHGIGGGKYDQLGDMVLRAHFGIEPPRFMVLSATRLLPGVHPPSGDLEIRRLRRELRETAFHPERFASDLRGTQCELSDVVNLRDRKRELLAMIPPRGHRKAWHGELSDINEQLAGLLSETRIRLRERLAAARSRAASERVLASREHPFCLYPLENLRSAFAGMLEAVATV